MAWYASISGDNLDEIALVPSLKRRLFPNDGQLQFMQSLILIIGSGLFACREALAQQCGLILGNDEELPSNAELPEDFEYELSEENGG